jgi:4-azaleucine resistance transporter AzlC
VSLEATRTPAEGAVESPRVSDGVRAAVPLAVGPLLFGASFGLLAGEAGMSSAAAIVMSATTFAGSAQFAAAGTLEAGGSALAAIVAASLLNARYVPMSVAVAGLFPGSAVRRFVEAQLIVDESWAISGRSGRFERRLLIGAGLLFYVCWIAGTAVGLLFGDSLADPDALGLDAAFPALFLGLLWPYVQDRQGRVAAALGALVTFLLIPVAPPGVPIVAAALVCLLGLRR